MFGFYILMLTAYFVPGFLIPGVGNVWISDFLLLAVLFKRLIFPPRVTLEYKSYMYSILMLPLFIFMLWLFVITILTLQASPTVSPLAALGSLFGRFRPILFLMFCVPYAADHEKLFKLFNFLIVLFVLQVAVVFCQKFNIAGINYWYTPRFRPADAEISYIFETGQRTIGTIGNPNSLGTFMSIFAVLGYALYTFVSGFHRWIGLATTFLTFIICVFFAGTRQGTLAIIAGCMLISLFAFFLGKIGRLSFVILLVILLSPVMMFYLVQNFYLFERFAILRGQAGVKEVGSFHARLELWPEFFNTFGGWAYIGKGMAGQIASITWDSGWLTLLVAGGFPLALIYLWWLLRSAWRCLTTLPYHANNPELVGFLLAGPATSFIVIITNIVNNTYNDTKVSIVIGLMFTLSLGASYHLSFQNDSYDDQAYWTDQPEVYA